MSSFDSTISLNHPFVFNPVPGVYEWANKKWGRNFVILKSEGVNRINWINFETLIYYIEQEKDTLFQWISNNESRMISKKSLSFFQDCDSPPTLLYSPSCPDYLFHCSRLTFDGDKSNLDTDEGVPIYSVRVCNEELQTECQDLIDDILVDVGDHPIFAMDSQPDFAQIHEIFRKFTQYNTDAKLLNQYEHSIDLCHIRAHFIAILLGHYHVAVHKVYKFWNEQDWSNFSHELWNFHCAVMITDSENQKWIWDPWVDFSDELPSLREWTHNENEPLPKKLLITNHVVISDYDAGSMDDDSIFWQNSEPRVIDAFQYLCMDAIPNSPELPLSPQSYEQVLRASKTQTIQKIKALICSYL